MKNGLSVKPHQYSNRSCVRMGFRAPSDLSYSTSIPTFFICTEVSALVASTSVLNATTIIMASTATLVSPVFRSKDRGY